MLCDKLITHENVLLTLVATVSLRFSAPTAWESERLYPWGEEQGDEDALQQAEDWTKYYKCHSVPINGKVGVVFFDDRYYNAYVSTKAKLELTCYYDLNRTTCAKAKIEILYRYLN